MGPVASRRRAPPVARRGGEIATTGLYFNQATRLPHWLWHAAFWRRTTVELIVEPDPDRTDRCRLIRYLGPRFDSELRRARADWLAGRVLEDPRFGRFAFDARTGSFDVKADGWEARSLVARNRPRRSDAIKHARRFSRTRPGSTRGASACGREVLPLKNENWLGDDEAPLTPETFLSRIN